MFTIRLPISCFFAAESIYKFDPSEHQLFFSVSIFMNATVNYRLKQMLVGHCQFLCGIRCDFSSRHSFIMNSNAVCIGRREKFICKNMLIELSQKPIWFFFSSLFLASCLAYVTRCWCSSLLFEVEKNFDSRFVLFH